VFLPEQTECSGYNADELFLVVNNSDGVLSGGWCQKSVSMEALIDSSGVIAQTLLKAGVN